MARNFDGKNSMKSSKDLWISRADYRTNAYPENVGLGGVMVKDLLFVERAYYGLIDTKDNSITAKQDFLKPLGSSRFPGGTPVAMDFVTDAFLDVKRAVEYACQAKLLSKQNQYISLMKPVKAYTPPQSDYETYLKKLFTRLNTEIVAKKYNTDRITNFDEYVKVILNYFDNSSQYYALTLTKWCRSQLSSVFNSGLAISIAELAIDKDEDKVKMFIDDPYYEYYTNLIASRGFSIMHNAPWILIADLLSPGMTPYLNKYKFRNLEDMFTKRYNNTIYYERDILRNIFYRYYRFFVIQNPRIKNIRICGGKTVQSYVEREKLTLTQFAAKYDDDFWLDTQILIKNIEDKVGFSPRKIFNMQERAKNLTKSFDIDAATSYINKEYGNLTWNKPYGYDDLLKAQTTSTGATDNRTTTNIKRQARDPKAMGGGGSSAY
tara:strand:+ start:4506 stop:5810 length:1305 start_codon:yes stop_codon:yes gene_type:complete